MAAGTDRELDLPDLAATGALASRLAASLVPGDILLLVGSLGAGKTTLVRFLVGGLGGDPAAVASPTFTLVHQYRTPAVEVVHVDAYRLAGDADLAETGALELGQEGLTCVEWADRLPGLLARNGCWRLELATMGPGKRHARLHVPAGRELSSP